MTRVNVDTTQQQVAAMFREQRRDTPQGYTNIEGGSEGVVGDSDAPFYKTPPFPDDIALIVDSLVVPVVGGVGAEYVALPEIECRAARLMQLYLSYTMAVGGQLSIIPELFSPIDGWYPMTLVGVTVTTFNPAGTRFPGGGFGSRPLQAAEFRTPVLTAGTARFAPTFEVSGAQAFRINVLDLTANAGNTLQAAFARAV